VYGLTQLFPVDFFAIFQFYEASQRLKKERWVRDKREGLPRGEAVDEMGIISWHLNSHSWSIFDPISNSILMHPKLCCPMKPFSKYLIFSFF
jgi:hypothetical protein